MDDEINQLLGKVTIAGGGVMPNINPVLLQKRSPLRLSQKKQKAMSSGKRRKPKQSESSSVASSSVSAINVESPRGPMPSTSTVQIEF
jgi:hypothetical protein